MVCRKWAETDPSVTNQPVRSRGYRPDSYCCMYTVAQELLLAYPRGVEDDLRLWIECAELHTRYGRWLENVACCRWPECIELPVRC